MKQRQKQEYYYKGEVYRYTIREDILRKIQVEEQIQDMTTWLYKLPQNAIEALYYCTCWGGQIVTKEEYLKDYENGLIRFSIMKCQYSLMGVRGLIREGLRRYRIS